MAEFEYVSIVSIADERLDTLYFLDCDYCEGDGMIVDNATEELIDCPRCDGIGVLSVRGPGLDDDTPDEDEASDADEG